MKKIKIDYRVNMIIFIVGILLLTVPLPENVQLLHDNLSLKISFFGFAIILFLNILTEVKK